MKFFTAYLSIGLLSVILLPGCQNDLDIGDLYGQWQITQVQTPEGEYTPTNIFLAFQSDVVFARLTGTDDHYADRYLGSFQHQADSLRISFYMQDASADVIHFILEKHFHFIGNHEDLRFGIKELNSKSLVLTRDDYTWTLHSY